MMTRTGTLLTVAAGGLALVACSAPAPAVPAVDLAPAGVAASAPAGPGATATAQGEYEVRAGDAATVRFAVTGDGIEVVEIVPAAGWTQTDDRRAARDVDLRFQRDATTVTLDAELDDGRFETDVDIDSPVPAGPVTYPVDDAGSVTVEVVGGRVGLVAQEAAPGWVATVDERELADGDVEIRFRDDAAARTVDFDADLDDGRLQVDIDGQTGRDYAAPPTR